MMNMKKSTYLLIITMIMGISTYAQEVGINTDVVDKTAILEITSADKALIIPRMRLSDIKEIPKPAKGLMVYNLSDHCLSINVGTEDAAVWKCYNNCKTSSRKISVSK